MAVGAADIEFFEMSAAENASACMDRVNVSCPKPRRHAINACLRHPPKPSRTPAHERPQMQRVVDIENHDFSISKHHPPSVGETCCTNRFSASRTVIFPNVALYGLWKSLTLVKLMTASWGDEMGFRTWGRAS